MIDDPCADHPPRCPENPSAYPRAAGKQVLPVDGMNSLCRADAVERTGTSLSLSVIYECGSRSQAASIPCRAINAEHPHRSVTLKDGQTDRTACRRKVRQDIKAKRGRVVDLLPAPPIPGPAPSSYI